MRLASAAGVFYITAHSSSNAMHFASMHCFDADLRQLGAEGSGEIPTSGDALMVLTGRIVSVVQDVFNLLPKLSVDELLTSFAVKSNDMMLAVYLASMIRRYMLQVDCTDVLGDEVIAM